MPCFRRGACCVFTWLGWTVVPAPLDRPCAMVSGFALDLAAACAAALASALALPAALAIAVASAIAWAFRGWRQTGLKALLGFLV